MALKLNKITDPNYCWSVDDVSGVDAIDMDIHDTGHNAGARCSADGAHLLCELECNSDWITSVVLNGCGEAKVAVGRYNCFAAYIIL